MVKIKTQQLTFLFIFLQLFSQLQSESLENNINKLKDSPELQHAQWSVYAEYCENGEAIVDFNSELSLAPASGLKLLTSGLALYYLGESFQYKTRLYYTGILKKNGTLKGNILLIGSGDPTLGSEYFPDNQAVLNVFSQGVKAKGIKRIQGDILIDNSLFSTRSIPDEWIWGDIGNYYGAGTQTFCIYDNLYRLVLKPGNSIDSKTSVIKTIPENMGLTFINYIKTAAKNSGDQAYIYSAPFSDTAVLRGTIPRAVPEFTIKGSIPNPSAFAALEFKRILENNGIYIKGKTKVISSKTDYKNPVLITSVASPSLEKIITLTNEKSINLYAEQLLLTFAQNNTGEGSFSKGIQEIEKALDSFNIDHSGLHLYDGSGLSRANMVTTKIMAQYLSAMTKENIFPSFYKSIPKKATSSISIKTGSMTAVRSHSGYAKTKSGKWVSYSIISNNYHGKGSAINKIHLKFLKKLAELN